MTVEKVSGEEASVFLFMPVKPPGLNFIDLNQCCAIFFCVVVVGGAFSWETMYSTPAVNSAVKTWLQSLEDIKEEFCLVDLYCSVSLIFLCCLLFRNPLIGRWQGANLAGNYAQGSEAVKSCLKLNHVASREGYGGCFSEAL